MIINKRDLREFKRLLTEQMPQIPPGYVMEAAARGLGFQHYAHMLDHIDRVGHITATSDDVQFEGYLGARGFAGYFHPDALSYTEQELMVPLTGC